LLDALAHRSGKTIEGLLGLPKLEGKFRYTAVLGDSGAKRFEAEIERYRQAGFRDFKIKLSGDPARDLDKVALLKAAGIAPASVRADANNLWSDADTAIAFLSRLDYGFSALEEPLKAGAHAGMGRIAAQTGCAIILDESMLRAAQLSQFSDAPARWIVNLRVSKMGGLLRSLEFLDLVRDAGLRVIVGAHVGETSLLTRAALTIANSARTILVAQEGAFGTHLLERDVIDPPIMFGAGGVLDSNQLPAGAGFGLNQVHPGI
jgi:L-alanine-DL-glutamate epimerase-like enolase superfamily enzyme